MHRQTPADAYHSGPALALSGPPKVQQGHHGNHAACSDQPGSHVSLCRRATSPGALCPGGATLLRDLRSGEPAMSIHEARCTRRAIGNSPGQACEQPNRLLSQHFRAFCSSSVFFPCFVIPSVYRPGRINVADPLFVGLSKFTLITRQTMILVSHQQLIYSHTRPIELCSLSLALVTSKRNPGLARFQPHCDRASRRKIM